MFRTDEAALVVGPFDVYPTGVELTFDVRLRQDDDDIDAFPWEPRRRRRGEPGTGPPDDFLRLGIEFADGRTWSNLDVSWPAVPDDPSGPILIGLGGSGGGRCWKGEHWLYPLPPPGPLRFFAEWPAFDIAECSATVDGGAIRAAADRAEVLWPD